MDSVVYPVGQETQLRTLSTCLSLSATTIISYCFAQRAYHVDFSPRALWSMKATKWLLLLLFIDSWAFVFLSGVLVNGIGMSLSPGTCSMGIFACIIFYCSSKLLTYLFLLEKVYIVWPNSGTRFSSTAYKIGFTAILGFIVVVVMMFIGRIAYIRDDKQCVIGLHKAASMTTVFVDLAVNILLTALFLWPLWQSKFLSVNIRRVASRTLIASFCALVISVTNLTILTLLHGKELGWICLGSCSTDVLVNAVVLFWLTKPSHNADEQSTGITGGRNRSDQGKSSGNNTNLRPISTAVSVYNSKKPHVKTLEEKRGSLKVDLERANTPVADTQYTYYSEVYDGSSQYLRSDQQLISPTIPSPSPTMISFKDVSSPTRIEYPPVSSPPVSYLQRSHSSIGFTQQQKKSARDTSDRHSFLEGFGGRNISSSNASKPGLLERLGIRSNSVNGDDPIKSMGLGSVGGVGMKKAKKRGGSDEAGDMQVRITITTHLENDDGLDEDLRSDSATVTNKKSSSST